MNRATSLTTSTKKKLLIGLLAALLGGAGAVASLYASNTAASDATTVPGARIGNDPSVWATLEANTTQVVILEPAAGEP